MKDFLFFKLERAYLKLRLSEILYVQAEKKYVIIVTAATSYQVLTSMNHIEKILPQDLFCRIHRSYIVSLEQISKFDNELIYIGSKKIPLAEQYKNVLKNSVIILNGDNRLHHLDNDFSKPVNVFVN
ncbi:MAG: LytR/AlgR family response regulator transcription factor [Chitinophagales bacterium]